MIVLAIDPGNEQSAWLVYDAKSGRPHPAAWKGVGFGLTANADLLDIVRTWGKHGQRTHQLAIEMIASYGMPVGREVFETCMWIGRFAEAWESWGRTTSLVYRKDVKMHMCGNNIAKDGNIRQALIDRFGPGKDKAIGKKASPGPLYGVTADVWSALAVAVTFADNAARSTPCS